MKVNYQGITVALPEYGKSSIAAAIIAKKLREGRWVFAHDRNRQFNPVTRCYASAGEWRNAARAAAERNEPMPRGASMTGKWSEVAALVEELGRRHNSVNAVHMPMLLVADESSLMDTSGATFVDKSDQEVMANRRHLGVELLFNVQTKTMLTEKFWTQATDVYLMAQPEHRLRELEKACHLRLGSLGVLLNLPPHRYVHVRPGRGFTTEAL